MNIEENKAHNNTALLLHAAIVGARSLCLLAKRLRAQGFRTVNLPYPNRELTISECAGRLVPAWEKLAADAPGPIHIIGHSMGGLVARRLLALAQPPNFGRLLTLGTPHLGSPLADRLKAYAFYRLLFGPAGQELTTGRPIDWLAPWPPPYEIGLLAGSLPIGPGSLILGRESDGTVLHASSQPAGGTEYFTVAATHITIPFVKATAETAGKFLLGYMAA